MSERSMTPGDTLGEVAQAVLEVALECLETREPLFVGVNERLHCHVSEFDIVFALGWLKGLADAFDRTGPRRIA